MAGSITNNVLIPKLHCAFAWTSNNDQANMAPISRTVIEALIPKKAAESSPSKQSLPTMDVISVSGPSPKTAATELFEQIRNGALDRSHLSPELNELFSDGRIAEAAGRLRSWGAIKKVAVESLSERGHMEVSTIRFEMDHHPSFTVTMFRHSDGKIAEFLF